MFRFFRQIRSSMLKENRVTRYLLYAIGEIVLVVIGILIALQVNNWNNHRNEAKEERSLLKDLNFEFSKNKEELVAVRHDYQKFISSTKALMDLIAADSSVVQRSNVDSLISESINYYDYRPTQHVVDELLSSGKLRLIRSDSLRSSLFEWASLLNEKEESWSTLDDFSQNMMMPFLTEHASLKNIDSYGFLNWEHPSKLESGTIDMFQDIEFENNLDNHAWSLANYIMTLDKLETCIDEIVQRSSQTASGDQ